VTPYTTVASYRRLGGTSSLQTDHEDGSGQVARNAKNDPPDYTATSQATCYTFTTLKSCQGPR